MIQSVWVEIPAEDIERALRFYTALFELDAVEIVDDGPRRTATMAVLAFRLTRPITSDHTMMVSSSTITPVMI